MARIIACLVAVLAVVAFAAAQSTSPIDDFRTVTTSFQLTGPSDSQSRSTAASSSNVILGGERELYIVATGTSVSPDCTAQSDQPQSSVEAGFWSVAQGRVCAASFELRLDGTQSAGSSPTKGFGLAANFNALGTGMRVTVSSDLSYSYTITIATSATSASSFTKTLPGSAADDTTTVLWSQFQTASGASSAADFSNVGALSFSFPGALNRDAEVSAWVFLAANGSINGSVFGDCNCNGSQDTGDNAVQSATVTLSGPGSSSTTTSSTGAFSFTNLASGTYTVTVSSITLCSGGSSKQVVVSAGAVANVVFNAQVGGSAISCPADVDANCGATSVTQTGNAQVTSVCTGGSAGSISNSDSLASQACTTPGGVIGVITRTFTATGAGSCTQRITVRDTSTAPSLSIPADFTTNDANVCAGTVSTSVSGAATASGACTTATATFTDTVSSTCNSGSCTFSSSIARRWVASDQCGNTSPAQIQTISCTAGTNCPTCPVCDGNTVPVTVPVNNPPTRNCRFICDDDDSSASILSVSVVAVLALFAMLF